jgi:hypothetical protein
MKELLEENHDALGVDFILYFQFKNTDFSEKFLLVQLAVIRRAPFSFSMCDSGKSKLNNNGNKDYSKDELNSKEFYSEEDKELDSEVDCSEDELDSKEVYSKDDEELDSEEDCSKDELDREEVFSKD